MNDTLTGVVVGLATLVSVVCYILVLIQMFQHGSTGLAIVCIVLSFCCGLGGLIGFIYGWVKANEWNIHRLMTVWTVAVAIDVVAGVSNPTPFQRARQNFHVATLPNDSARPSLGMVPSLGCSLPL